MSNNFNYKSFSAFPFKVTDAQDMHELPLDVVLEGILHDVRMITRNAGWEVYSNENLPSLVAEHSGIAANVAGRRIGLSIPEEDLQDYRVGKSRYNMMFRDRVVREIRSFNERKAVVDDSSGKYVSQGRKRTANDTTPEIREMKMSLSATDTQFAKIINNPFDDGFIKLKHVIRGNWYHVYFPFDTQRFSDATKVTLPDIEVDEKGRVVYRFTAAYEYHFTQFSSRYVVGIDVGIAYYATAVVWDVETQQVVHESNLSRRVHALTNSLRACEAQKNRLFQLGRFAESALHRKAAIGKKEELAIVAAQEIADIAFVWDNAVVIAEDLSWIENTMQSGRWNRGRFMKWLQHYVELNGSRVIKVSPRNTSQQCHKCDGKVSHDSKRRVTYCASCNECFDRDVNAATNVARRGVKTVEKMRKTRAKAKRVTNRQVRRSPKTHNSLRYPGRDRTKYVATPRQVKRRKHTFAFVEVMREVTANNMCSLTRNDDGTVVSDETSTGFQDSEKATRNNTNSHMFYESLLT